LQTPLVDDPGAERISVGLISRGDTGITVLVDIARKQTESLLPAASAGLPRPAFEALKSAFAIGIESPFGAFGALRLDPSGELIAVVFFVGRRDTAVTVLVEITRNSAETLLP
jgi:hypothetical protein